MNRDSYGLWNVRVCPRCTGENIVIATTSTHKGVLRRQRACGACQHRFYTYEIAAGDFTDSVLLRKHAALEIAVEHLQAEVARLRRNRLRT